ncbi:MAG TPA: cyanophycin synthetase, partial [Chloroflexota bacterium]
LSTLRATTPGPGRLIAVFGAAGGRDRQKRPTLAQIAREFADYAIITNEDPFGEEATEIMAQIAAGLPPGEEGVRFHREPDRARAIEMALELARPGDTVAVLGKGHEQSIAENGRSVSWSDVEVVRAALGVHA